MRYEDRVEALERELAELRSRLDRLEGRSGAEATPLPPATPTTPPPPAPARPAEPEAPSPPAPSGPAIDLEDLLGGRVLAWLGGAAVVLGVVFFLAMAVANGWIDEPTRVVLAFLGSTALLCAGL